MSVQKKSLASTSKGPKKAAAAGSVKAGAKEGLKQVNMKGRK